MTADRNTKRADQLTTGDILADGSVVATVERVTARNIMVDATNAATRDWKRTYAASAKVELGTVAAVAPPPSAPAPLVGIPNQQDEAARIRCGRIQLGIEKW